MSYQGPMMIKQPELRWPVYVVAAVVTLALALLAAGMTFLSMTHPYSNPYEGPLFESAVGPGEAEFEQFREQIMVEELRGIEKLHPFNNLALEVTAIVRNNTGRTVSALAMRGAVVDAHNSLVRERTIVVIPAQQTALEPDEAINVRVLLERISPDAERAHVLLEVTALRLD